MASSDPPDFSTRSELLEHAYCFARAAHEGERRRASTRIDHPIAVARLLAGQGADDQMIAVALLHDVLEDTTVTREELEGAFGRAIAGRVAELTEDASIEGYGDRKAALRRQIAEAGQEAATISLADKLAKVRAYEASGEEFSARQLEHYGETVALLSSAYPDLPFITDLRQGLRNARTS